MIIKPDLCSSCGLCLAECPVGAIVETEDDSPEWAKINSQLAASFGANPAVAGRPRNDPPRVSGNVLINP